MDCSNDNYFHLKLTEMKVGDGALPVTWCINPEKFKDIDIDKCYILLATCPPTPDGGNAEWRGYAKLSEMMAYVTFFRPGINRIFAKIVFDKSHLSTWMCRNDGKFDVEVISFPHSWCTKEEIEKWDYKIRFDINNPHDYLQIDLPNKCFAPEPSDLEKSWVNWLYSTKATDQCEFRRRRIFAYTLQWFIFLPIMLLRLMLVLFFTSLFLKNVCWAAIFKPLCYSTADIIENVGGSYLYFDKLPLPLNFIFVPMIPLGTITGICLGTIFKQSLLQCLIGSFIGGLWLPFGSCIILILSGFFCFCIKKCKLSNKIDFVFNYLNSKNEGVITNLQIKNKNKNNNIKELELLTCANEKIIHNINDLPKSKRTIKLQFNGIKSFVCRPFAR